MSFTPDQLDGRTVCTSDGDKIGKVDAVFLDAATSKPEWVTVSTGLFGKNVSFIPLAAANAGPDGDVLVPFDKSKVKDSPNFPADQALSESDEAQLFNYYGIPYGGETVTATGGPAADTGAGRGRAAAASDGGRDSAMTRSEEQLRVGTERRQAGRARLRKYVVTENVTQTVPVSHEEIRVEREPVTEANADAAMQGPEISESEHEVVLHEEKPVVAKEAVPVERVRLDTETVAGEESVSEDVRKERIDLDDAEAKSRSHR